MARRNSRFVNQKIIIGNKSIQAGDLTDSAKDELGADSDFVKTVDGLDGNKISNNTINPSAIANQDQLISGNGALTTGGILTIARDRGQSFMNFDSVNTIQDVGDSNSFAISPLSGSGFSTVYQFSSTTNASDPIPFTVKSRLRFNLDTPDKEQDRVLLNFFGVNAGAEGDEIHSVQILDSATENDYEYYLSDEVGNFHYLKLLDSIPYGDPRLTVADSNNEIFINNSQRSWQGLKNFKVANSPTEFDSSTAFLINNYTRDISSRFRFTTRKSVPALIGGAPANFKVTAPEAPEGPIGAGVSDRVYSRVSPKFQYKAILRSAYQGSVAGYTTGGLSLYGPYSTTIDKFSFTSDGPTTAVGNLNTGVFGGAGASSATDGYSSGGASYPGPGTNRIDKFPFASFTTATNVGTQTLLRYNTAGATDSLFGYAIAGQTPGLTNVIDKYPFASGGASTDVGDTSGLRHGVSSQSGKTHAYASGGNPITNVIEKFPFSSDTNATDVGDLTASIYQTAGQQSDTHGYVSGGRTPTTVITTVQKFPFSSDTNATDVGDLSLARTAIIGHSSTVSGYTSAQTSFGGTGIDKFPFASDGTATAVGNDGVDFNGSAQQE